MMRAQLSILFIAFACGAAPSFAGGLWTDDYEKAVGEAKAEGKFLLLDFTGSDWCGWCIRLKGEVFDKAKFKKYARDNLVCVEVDFPKRKNVSARLKEQNDALMNRFGVRGFPSIIILTPDEEAIGRTGYRPGGVDPYLGHLDDILAPHRDKLRPDATAAAARTGGTRTWTSVKGATIDARYYQRIGETVVLQKGDGGQIRIGFSDLSESDQEFLRSIRAF